MRFFTPVAAFLLVVLTYGAAYVLYSDIQKSALLIETSRDQVATITARDTFAKAAAQFLAETTAERNAIQFFLVPLDGTAQAIELVETAGKLAGVRATVGAASVEPLGAHHERLDISVSAEGTFSGLARFATVLESLPRGSVLENISISETEKGWFGTYAVTFIKQK